MITSVSLRRLGNGSRQPWMGENKSAPDGRAPGYGRRPSLSPACSFLAALTALVGLSVPARALDIVLIDISSPPMTATQLAAFDAAAALWEAKFRDAITVQFNVGLSNFPPRTDGLVTLGQTRTARTTHPYTTVRTALHAQAETATEKSVMLSLPASSVPLIDVNGSRSTTSITMGTANAKALGLGTGRDTDYAQPPPGVDAQIVFNSNFPFDYERSDGIAVDEVDFIGVAAHEIGHALGFFSVVDVQDFNPGFTLQPNTLDLWRFQETGGSHAVGSQNRFLTAGPAEYFDSVLSNISFSQGMGVGDASCGCSLGGGLACQASHWRDCAREQMMDPIVPDATVVNIHNDDRHALDYMGYEDPFFLIRIPRYHFPCFFWRWYDWRGPFPGIAVRIGCELEIPFPEPPIEIDPPFDPNVGMVIGFDLGPQAGKLARIRSATGVALFREAIPNQNPVVKGLPDLPGQMNLYPGGEPLKMLPPALLDMYFVSDSEHGPRLTARAMFSESGAELDPTLGKFGGYRVTLAIDGAGDKEEGDVDGMLTIELLADESGVPDPKLGNEFGIDPRKIDNGLVALDPEALGLPAPAWLEIENFGKMVRISWPVGVREAVLQSSQDMKKWANVDWQPEQIEDRWVVEVPVESRLKYFRLLAGE